MWQPEEEERSDYVVCYWVYYTLQAKDATHEATFCYLPLSFVFHDIFLPSVLLLFSPSVPKIRSRRFRFIATYIEPEESAGTLKGVESDTFFFFMQSLYSNERQECAKLFKDIKELISYNNLYLYYKFLSGQIKRNLTNQRFFLNNHLIYGIKYDGVQEKQENSLVI